MDAARYTALAERLIVVAEPGDGTGIVTVAGSAVGGGALSRAEADAAAKTVRPLVARAVTDLLTCPQDDDTSREMAAREGERVAEKLVDVAEILFLCGREWRVTLAEWALCGAVPLEEARHRAECTRADLAAALQRELEGEAEAPPDEAAAADNAELAAARARIAELEAQLAAAEALAHKHLSEQRAALLIRNDATKRAEKLEAERDVARREVERLKRENARLRDRLADEPPETEQAPDPRGRAVEGR